MEREVVLTVDGKNIPLNPFTEDVMRNVLLGLATSLKGINLDGEIVVKIDRKK